LLEANSLLRKSAALTRQLEEEIVAAVRLDDVPNIDDEAAIFESADIVAAQIKIPPVLLEFLQARSRWQPMAKDEWSHRVRAACAIDLMLRAVFKQRLGKFGALIEGRQALDGLPPGTLLFSFHGAFVRLARPLFADAFPDGLQIDKRFTKDDSRGALFGSLRALQDGKRVLTAPDGNQGQLGAAVRVLGVETPVGEGAAYLAYTLGCNTAWYTVTRQERRFVTCVEAAPRREENEAFASFSERFWQFYAAKIEDNFTGDPRNISLLPRWRRPFTNHISLTSAT
jgi:hypothetical protein